MLAATILCSHVPLYLSVRASTSLHRQSVTFYSLALCLCKVYNVDGHDCGRILKHIDVLVCVFFM